MPCVARLYDPGYTEDVPEWYLRLGSSGQIRFVALAWAYARAPLVVAAGIVAAVPVVAADVEAGRMLYKRFCAHCHGIDRASAGGASSDLRRFPRAEPDRFFATVQNGRGLMPALGSMLSAEDLESLWVFVATRGGAEPLPDEGVD